MSQEQGDILGAEGFSEDAESFLRGPTALAENVFAMLDRGSGALRRLATIAGLGVWEWSSGTDTLWWNTEMFRMFDVDEATFEGKYASFAERVHPHDVDRVGQLVGATAVGGVFKAEYTIVLRDGAQRRIAASGRRLISDDGVERLMGICLDVTDAWRATSDAERYRMLFQTAELVSGIGAWRLNKLGEVTWSDNVYRIHGFEVGDGKPSVELEWAKSFYPPEARDRVSVLLERALSEGEGFEFELPFTDARGVDRVVYSKAMVQRGPDDEVESIFGVFEDVTERRRTERQLQKHVRLQEMLFEELDHRVRNNLGSLLSLIELGAKSAECVSDFADAMSHRVRTMASIHTLVTRANYDVVPMERILDAILDGDASARVEYAGPTVQVPPESVSPMAMILAEMTMNARKYGALSQPEGSLQVRWLRESVDADRVLLKIRWTEETPGVVSGEVEREGVGMRIIRGMSATELHGSAEVRLVDGGLEGQFEWVVRSV